MKKYVLMIILITFVLIGNLNASFESKEVVEKFNKKYNSKNSIIEFNPKLKYAWNMFTNIDITQSRALARKTSAENEIYDFLKNNEENFKIKMENLKLEKYFEDKVNYYFSFKQYYKNIKIE